MEQLYTNLGVSSTEMISTQTNGYLNKMQFNRWLSMSCILFLVLINGFNVAAQSASNYVFTTSTSGSLIDISSGSTLVVGASNDDTPSGLFDIGFEFVFMGSVYTQFSASPDGFIKLGGPAAAAQFTNSVTSTTNLPKIYPYWDDLATGVGGYIRYKVIGSAPNRSCVVEWFTTIPRNTTGNANSTYQVVLNETSNSFSFNYGNIVSNGSYSVGFTNSSAQFASVSLPANTVSYSVANDINSAAITSGLQFLFTPSSSIVNGNVTNLTFTAITLNGITLNWEDNATNEVGFSVLRATDSNFTQNVQSFFVASTSSASIGTGYNLPQTGLTPGTTYYYRVYATVEAGSSPAISGNQATLTGATYYWVGASGAAWNTFANWNTAADGTGTAPTVWAATDVHIIDGAGTTPGGALTISVDRTSFSLGQFRVVDNTNLTLQSSATTTRTLTITGGPGDDFVIEAGSSLNMINGTQAVAFIFSGTGNTGLIAGNYTAGGSTSNNFTTTGGTGTLVTVAATGVITSNLNSSSAGLVGNAATLLFTNGSNWIHQNSTTVNYIPSATWQSNATATLAGNTTGTTLTSSSTALGNLIVNTTTSTVTLSAFTTATRIIQGDFTINSTGTGRFRVVTTGLVQVNGNLNLNGGLLDIASGATGAVIVKGNVNVSNGAILDINQGILQVEGNMVNNGSILSSETTTSTSRINFVLSPNAQTFSGSGTFTGRVSGIGVSNPLGLTISTPVLTQRVNLFTGTVTGASNITIGTGAALAAVVQVGTANNTNPGGSFDTAPVFNLGTGVYSVLYLGETTPRTTGFEIPSSRIVNNLTLDNVNGLTIAGGPIEVTGNLTLTNGLINSSLASHIVHGSATSAGTLTGGSATSYINGPIIRTINDANANTNFNLFPVGKGGSYNPVWLAPATTSASRFLVEAFDSNTGTADMSISNLSSSRRWEAIKTSGTFTDINVRLGETSLISDNIIAHASTASGVYSAPFGGVSNFVAGTPNTIESLVAVNEVDYVGYLSFATSNACTGAPAPGNTVASSTAICLGESVDLSLQNIVVGAGITYQWFSSSDGVTYAPIASATASTLNVTPTAATYYQCVVTCTNSSQSTTSTPVLVGFANAILSTTPATICGAGQATLAVTATSNSTVRWYDTPTAGNIVGNGVSFTTPSINTTTTYYAEAQGSQPGNVQLGAGTATSAADNITPYTSNWEGARTQYLVRASELQALGLVAGAINSLAFDVTASGSFTQSNYTVRIGTVGVNALSTSAYETLNNPVVVFGPINKTTPAVGLDTLNFTTPFNWDGTSNIVIEVCHDNDNITSPSCPSCYGPNSTVRISTTSFNSVFGRRADNSTLCGTNDGTALSSGFNNRPNMRFNGVVACSSPRVPVIATVTTPPTFTLSSNTQTICAGDTSAAITISAGANDYDTFVWSPSTGVSGDAINGWTFNPNTTTNYTLTVSQTTGDLCTITANVQVNVNPLPSALVITPSAPVTCENEIVSITVSGGQIGVEGKIGAQTSTNTSTTPFRGWWGGTKTQALYTPAELTALGVTPGESIKKIGYLALAGTPIPLNDFQVRVGLVPSSTSLGTTFISGANNLVFGPASYTPLATGNIEFPLSTPIVWDGTSSLLVETCFNNNNGGGVSANSISVESSTVTAGLMNSLQQDNNPTVCSNNTPSTSTLRPNLLISTKESFDFVWTPIANLYTDAAAQVPYIAGANASTVYFKGNANATYTVTVTPPSNCSVNGNVTVTVNPTPSAPTAATQDFCANASPTVADLVATGDNLKWYDVATGGTPLLATSALISGNYYVSQTLLGCESPRTTVQVNVNDCNIGWANLQWPASGTIGTCGNYTVYGQVYKLGVTEAPGPNANITAWFGINSSNTDPSTWDASAWQIATYNVQAGNNDEYQYTFNNLPAGTYYIASRFQFTGGEFWYGGFNTGGGGAWDGNNNVSSVLTVLETIAPSASNQTFCGAATVASLVATGTALQWYDVATGGSPLAANAPIVTGTYYVSQTLNGCEGPRATVEVTINITPAPTASAQVFCSNSTVADLVATGADLQWYDVASGGVALASNTVLISGTYYVSQTLNNCEGPRTTVQVTVNPSPVTPNFNETVCNTDASFDLNSITNPILGTSTITALSENFDASTTLPTGWQVHKVSGTGTTTWIVNNTQSVSAPNSMRRVFGGSGEGFQDDYLVMPQITVPASGVLTYQERGQWMQDYVYSGVLIATNGNGNPSSSAYVQLQETANIPNNAWQLRTIDLSAYAGQQVYIAFRYSGTFAHTWWIDNVKIDGLQNNSIVFFDSNNVQLTNTIFNPSTATQGNNSFTYTITNGNNCSSTGNINILVNATASPTASNQNFCNAATVADLVAIGSSLQWYDVASGGSPLSSNTALVSGTYYVSQTLNGCESTRTTVEVTINSTTAPTASAQSFCGNANATVASLVATGSNLQWYDVATGGTALPSNTALVSGTYYVSQTLNNCESTRTSVVVTIDDCNIGWGNLQWPPSGTINTCGDYTVYGRVWKQGATEAPGPNANITAWFGISTTNTDPSTWPSSAWVLGTYNVQVGNDDEYQHTFSNLPSGTYYIASRYQFTGGDFWYGGFNSGGGGAWNGTSNVSSVLTVEEVPTPTGDALQSVTVPLAPDATLANLVVSGTNVTWYATLADAQAGTNALPLSTVLVSGNTYYAVSIVNGCRSAALAVTVTVNLDIRVFDFAQLRVYPNPVIDRLTITFDHQLERIEVYNMLGQMVRFQQPNFTETEVDMINLPAATYIVRIYSNDSVKEVKVIKK
ncbi:MAG: choice-of-anchor J domain-containing protein [Flavobacteriales bacterium]|nr:choice-of-anchor J domain-containing protein [Flavobacteriales bacterium]